MDDGRVPGTRAQAGGTVQGADRGGRQIVGEYETESDGPSGCDAGRKVKGSKRHIAVDVEGCPIGIQIHNALVQDRDEAPTAFIGMLEKALHVAKLWADGGNQGSKLAAKLEELGLKLSLEIIHKPKDVRGSRFRTAAGLWSGLSPGCRADDIQAKDYGRSLESSTTWAQLAACRSMLRRFGRALTTANH